MDGRKGIHLDVCHRLSRHICYSGKNESYSCSFIIYSESRLASSIARCGECILSRQPGGRGVYGGSSKLLFSIYIKESMSVEEISLLVEAVSLSLV